MTRIPRNALAGVVAAIAWLASGSLYAAIVWFQPVGSDALSSIIPETIPLELWHAAPALTVLIVAGSTVAVGAGTGMVAGWITSGADRAPRALLFAGVWLAVMVVAAVLGLLEVAAHLIGGGPPPSASLLLGAIPAGIAPTLYGGLVLGWIPALVFARSRASAVARWRPLMLAAIGIAAALAVIVGSSIATSEARSTGLAGVLPPAVQQPHSTPTPTVTPPPAVVPAAGAIDPSWCRADQLTIVSDGGDGATGHREGTLRATNTGTIACVLDGYPDVAFADLSGDEIHPGLVHGGSFMTTDPGPSAQTLQPGGSVTADLGWDATDGRTLIGAVWVAGYAGAARTQIPVSFDITASTQVAVTAWEPSGPTVSG